MILEIFHHHHHSWSTPTGDSLFKGPPLLLAFSIQRNYSCILEFFLFHPSILKPNLDLGFIEMNSASNFNSSGLGWMHIEMELFIQLC